MKSKMEGTTFKDSDKEIEARRYNQRSLIELNRTKHVKSKFGSESLDPILRSPYLCYERSIKDNIEPQYEILELGSGSGLHTETVLKTGAKVVATDIAPATLELLMQRLGSDYSNLETKVADMEMLPFPDESFDIVCSAGSLSYGDVNLVTSEVYRVLKSDGMFIFVDSFNHNPIYRLNRFVHYLKGQRSKSTLRRIPNRQTLKTLSEKFNIVSVNYFGIFTFLGTSLSFIFNDDKAKKIIDSLDEKFSYLKDHAFKIVITAKKNSD